MNCNPQKCPVNCIWGDWVKGTCSKTCGGGHRTDERTITKPEENGGTCEGKPTRVVNCNEQKCPLTGIPCCMEKGVDAMCLGKCLDMESPNNSQRRSLFARLDFCTKYEKIAATCREKKKPSECGKENQLCGFIQRLDCCDGYVCDDSFLGYCSKIQKSNK